jgi:phosphatidylglycerol lysyltransferase
MLSDLSRRRYLMLWQLLLLIVGTSWLWAPHLNSSLSSRTSLISQYESPIEPFSWLFRLGDLLAGGLLLLMSLRLLSLEDRRIQGWLLFALSLGVLSDPLLSTTCHNVGNTCTEYFSISYVLHAVETVFTSSMFFIIGIYDVWRRKKLVSILFTIFQILYGGLFVSQLANQEHFNTVSQYVYQLVLIVWLAWFCRDNLAGYNFFTSRAEGRLARNLAAVWAFLNGIIAILISLAHINLLGRIRGLYFTGDSAWLAQHGIIIGVIMIYLARHLARGEARARQIFLLLAGLETVKYAVVSPHAGLMLFYMVTFVVLFIFRDDFDRGSVPLTWSIRLRDLVYLLIGLLLAALLALIALDRDDRVSTITLRAADHFTDYIQADGHLPHRHISSVLLAHSATAFIIASLSAVLWILFRPYSLSRHQTENTNRIEQALKKYSGSSEDFFKLWPPDKQYFWNKSGSGFLAYRIVGPIAFVLADPIGPNPGNMIEYFNRWCRARRLKICYLPVYQKSLPLYEAAGLEPLQIGSSALIDIREFLNQTARDKWWRWRINRAQKNGYAYSLAEPPHSSRFLRELKSVSDIWLAGGHAERGFALGYFNEEYLQKCRMHCLRDEAGKLIAFTNQLPQFGQKSIVTIDLLRHDSESESMAYLLFRTIEEAARDPQHKIFDLGFVPFAKARGPLLTIAKSISSDRFSSKGLEQFKNKFDPDWQPNYLVYEGDITDLAIIALNIEKALER